MEQPKRSEDKYWQGTRNFDHVQFEMDLEEYISELEERMEAKVISSNPLVMGELPCVHKYRSGFDGKTSFTWCPKCKERW